MMEVLDMPANSAMMPLMIMQYPECIFTLADLDGQRVVNSGQRGGKNGNSGEVQLTVKEMLDVPSDSGAPDLAQGDREAFAEAGVLERSRSLQPGDRVPPQPLVKTLEEVADKLGEHSSCLQ